MITIALWCALSCSALVILVARSERVRKLSLFCGLLLTLRWTPAMPMVMAPTLDALVGGYAVQVDPWHEQHCWWIHKVGYRCLLLSVTAR